MPTMVPDFTRLAALVRMLSSNSDGEVLAAVAAIKRTLRATGGDIHSIADKLAAPAPKLSDAEMQKLFDAGRQQGILEGKAAAAQEAKAKTQVNAGFHPVSGSSLSWNEIAEWCDDRSNQLRGDREQEFVSDMTLRRYPLTEKQAKWLGAIYVRLGGNKNDLPAQ